MSRPRTPPPLPTLAWVGRLFVFYVAVAAVAGVAIVVGICLALRPSPTVACLAVLALGWRASAGPGGLDLRRRVVGMARTVRGFADRERG